MSRKALQVIVSIVVMSIFVTPSYAKTLNEIEKEIEEKEQSLEELEQQLEQAEAQELNLEWQLGTTYTDVDAIKEAIVEIDSKVKSNENKMKALEEKIDLKGLELEKALLERDTKLQLFYVESKDDVIGSVLENEGVDDFWKEYNYRETILDNDLSRIDELTQELDELNSQKASFEKELDSLKQENEELAQRKAELEAQIGYLSNQLVNNESWQAGLIEQKGSLQQELEGLTEEQRRLLEEERKAYEEAGNGGTLPLVPGEYYFGGRGRELYQGHGLGFSQYGAKGGALNGMTAHQIVTFYYSGSQIGYGYENHVAPNGQNIEVRISYLGEVPDYACGTQAQEDAHPEKYRVPNSDYWENGCWPEEAIKAQIIVARSYALKGGTAQVFKSTNYKKWAVDETKGQAVEVPGVGLVAAYYSADNNNGWGTGTHRNPKWCWDFNGNCGSGYSWLQGVSDSSFAAKGPYTDWTWRTNSYSISEIRDMFVWYSTSGLSNAGDVKNLINAVGDIQDLQIERDVSGRVARVNVVGTVGSVKVNGDIFKMIFTSWVYNVRPSGELDPIFSLTYYFYKHE